MNSGFIAITLIAKVNICLCDKQEGDNRVINSKHRCVNALF